MRVLAIDDSLFFRKLLRRALTPLEEVSFICSAANAKDALNILEKDQFDLIFVDLNMYKINGLEFIQRLRSRGNQTPAFLLSSASVEEIESCVANANLGAIDYIIKPENKNQESPESLVQKLLLPYIRNTEKTTAVTKKQDPTLIRRGLKYVSRITDLSIDALVIGSSTGGPQTLEDILTRLSPPPFPMFLSQHMPDAFIKAFAERIDRLVNFPVVVPRNGEIVKPGVLYISRSGQSMIIKKSADNKIIKYTEASGPNNIFPSVNHLFSSAAQVYQDRLLGIVLTGMGNDGTEGSAEVKKFKGHIITQTEESSVVYGMPASVDRMNLSDLSIAPLDIVDVINSLSQKIMKKAG